MNIQAANINDLEFISKNDTHISKNELKNLFDLQRIYVIKENTEIAGWLRYNLFWDNTPFMNMLYITEPYRGKGYGRALVQHWEKNMKKQNYSAVMTSTASDEYAQHFYNKLHYITVGGFTPIGDTYEIILSKEL